MTKGLPVIPQAFFLGRANVVVIFRLSVATHVRRLTFFHDR